MSMKLLSIIIPSYNMEKYLDKCIGSCIIDDDVLLQQLEVLVVNDGSTDRTSEIGHSWERNYPGVVRVIDKMNGNYGSCINAALPIASGMYVKVLDADDYLETVNFAASLRKLSELAQEQDPIDLFVSQYAVVDEAGNVSSVADFGLEGEGYKVFTDKRVDTPRFTVQSIVYRTDILRKLNYRQTEGISYTDIEWVIEPMALVRRFYYLNQVVTKYLVGRAGQTVEAETYRQRFQQVVDVTHAIVSRFDHICAMAHPDSVAFYEKLVVQMVEYVYSAAIFGWQNGPVTCDLKAFDNSLQKNSRLYIASSRFIRSTPLFTFAYVAEWRRRQTAVTFKFYGYRGYCRLRKMLKAFGI